MNADSLKLTVYCGERDRHGHSLVCDLLLDLFQRHQIEVSILMRGVEGFGIKHRLRTDRMLTLSEDLSLVIVAVDTQPIIERLLSEVRQIVVSGTVTLERVQLMRKQSEEVGIAAFGDAAKLTIYCGRRDRVAGRPAYLAVVEALRSHGVAGATVLLGLDGTFHGGRERGRFFSNNSDVPMMIISVGKATAIASALPEITAALPRPIMTLERVQICKRDGQLLRKPETAPQPDSGELAIFQKLIILSGEQSSHESHPLHLRLIQELRASGASGATALRGIWGYSHDGPPHGDRFWSLRRHVPIVTVLVDEVDRIADSFAIVDRLTSQTGVVTSEFVPAFLAASPHISRGGLILAPPHPGR